MPAYDDRAKRADRRRDCKIVPYDELDAAVEHVRAKYPGADKYAPCFNGGRIFVEVWNDGGAQLYEVTPVDARTGTGRRHKR